MNCLDSVGSTYVTDDISSQVESSCARSRSCSENKDDCTSSESGWTKYFEQTATESFLKTEFGFQCKNSKISGDTSHEQSHGEGLIVADSSMASDASSGPEHPVTFQDSEEQPQKRKVDRNNLEAEEVWSVSCDDACKSTRSGRESLSAVPPRIQFKGVKRRKKHISPATSYVRLPKYAG
ncbi:hypothetical protein O6H91_07G098000 [Diphasiastrum complanatum]|uniref:Uncharacterized protein n=1 Tax=Diphasiastrum complanatum TaxID=34168 RepID=A0ACC2D7Y3_DIPCM|nr:hypothetical protein O6H91_07G098000 [Diphasiastrum complanatum]